MGSLFSAVSGTFTKPILIGMLFPTLLFLVFFLLFVAPMLPWETHLAVQLAALDPEWKLAAFTLAAIVIVVFLYTLNSTIYRLYQGYPWRSGPLGEWLTRRRREPLERDDALLLHLDRCRRALRDHIKAERKKIEALPFGRTQPLDDLAAREEYLYEQLDKGQRIIVERAFFEYPKPSSVLPTRFGNAVRSFENYSYRQYGISAVPLWPRFRAKLDSSYATSIDEAKSHVDLALNLSLLSTLLFVLVAWLGIIFPVPLTGREFFVPWVLKLGGTAFLAAVFYRIAVRQTIEWGNLVRGAFDLYRNDVLKALGFTQEPRTQAEERKLWNDISRQYGYGDRVEPPGPTLQYRPSSPPATECKPNEKIRMTRGVSALVNGIRTIYTRVDNGNANAAKVVVTDRLSGQQYIWGSAKAGAVVIAPEGMNPYEFAVDVPANGSVVLKYQVSEPEAP
jgi:hypothetical protein